jgi:uncharacterized protein
MMTTRTSAPQGAPCWTDLWTSDVEGSRAFYSELFGWEAEAPSPEFGGYFMFTRDGVPVAGAMGPMPEMPANDTWKIYLSTDDVEKTVELARSEGAEVIAPPSPVADLGIQSVLIDPAGAAVGAWQPGTFPGFTVLNEQAAPGWFELHSRDYAKSIEFYENVFRWETTPIGDGETFRYSVMRDPSGEGELAGIMDASPFLPEGGPSFWYVYWEVDDVDRTVAKLVGLGGSVVMDPEDTPYGRLATVTDPSGAEFKLGTRPTD